MLIKRQQPTGGMMPYAAVHRPCIAPWCVRFHRYENIRVPADDRRAVARHITSQPAFMRKIDEHRNNQYGGYWQQFKCGAPLSITIRGDGAGKVFIPCRSKDSKPSLVSSTSLHTSRYKGSIGELIIVITVLAWRCLCLQQTYLPRLLNICANNFQWR